MSSAWETNLLAGKLFLQHVIRRVNINRLRLWFTLLTFQIGRDKDSGLKNIHTQKRKIRNNRVQQRRENERI